jgi:dipeptidyl aminopeptidase/acylaminoacyl peptidase
MKRYLSIRNTIFIALSLALMTTPLLAAGLDETQITTVRSVGSTLLSPDGEHAAYTLSIPRELGKDKNGAAWSELRLRTIGTERDRLFIGRDVSGSSYRFSPDGTMLTYLAKRGEDKHRSLWSIPIDGGESRRLLSFETKIETYRISPDGKTIAFTARREADKDREKAKKKGYNQEIFEEDWSPRLLWTAPFPGESSESEVEPDAIELEGSAFQIEWAPNSEKLAVTLAARPLIDESYMMQRIHIIDPDNGEVLTKLNNSGKLGAIRWSPDSQRIAILSAGDPNDPSAGRLLIGSAEGGDLTDPLPGIEAHFNSIQWQDAETVMYLLDIGSETEFGEVRYDGSQRKAHFRSGGESMLPLPRSFDLSADGQTVIFGAERPTHPRELFVMKHGEKSPRRLTHSNPWLDEVELAKQEVVTITARDGLQFEGILIHPLNKKKPAPLILMVHGGPESHDRNGWITNYSRPGQLAAAKGYAVLYPNYRGSTGRGVAFSKTSQGDAAGAEFDDLVDAVNQLVEEGVTDRDHVGITGGSYGGYATAWGSTRYSEVFRAGVMFVGISNKVSKGLTTEIPVEDVMVHTLFDPWTKWDFALDRSPVFHAEKSRTALLIAHGQDDSRVHPAQSLQLYRALKLIGKTPVRYVRYPGEGHGNRKAAARDDYTRRMMRWFDQYLLTDEKELPEWDLPPLFMSEAEDEEQGEDEQDDTAH